MKTWSLSAKQDIPQKWWLVDASGCSLGRLASEVSVLLRGKHKPIFTPHIDTGDFVIVINAKNIYLSGKKQTDKKYFSHSGFFGSLKQKTAQDLLGSQMIQKAVAGMLPKNKMRKKLLKKLKIYETEEHPHAPQKPMAYSCLQNKKGNPE